MSAPSWEEVKHLLAAALERPPSERDAFVRARCADPDLRAEVDALIREHDEAPAFLESGAAAAGDLAAGSRVGPYLIVERLGAGGMGEVFLGSDTRLRRKVALKRLLAPGAGAQSAHAQILHEARAAARVSHPNIAVVHDVVERGSRAFIVMEYVEGETLAARLRRGPLPIDRTLAIGRQLASALAAAHAHGIVHRDLKPANIQVAPDGSVKILDFGVAQAMARLSTSDGTTTAAPAGVADERPGTPAYMSPEQLLGRPVDHRSDLFSLGLILYEMATARRPYGGTGAIDIVRGAQPADPARRHRRRRRAAGARRPDRPSAEHRRRRAAAVGRRDRRGARGRSPWRCRRSARSR